jgi:hypothetical protein
MNLSQMIEAEFGVADAIRLEVCSRNHEELVEWLSGRAGVLAGVDHGAAPNRVVQNITLAARLLCAQSPREAADVQDTYLGWVGQNYVEALADRLERAYRDLMPGAGWLAPAMGIFVHRGRDLNMLCRQFSITRSMLDPSVGLNAEGLVTIAVGAGTALAATGHPEHFPVAGWLATQGFVTNPTKPIDSATVARATFGESTDSDFHRVLAIEVATWAGEIVTRLIPLVKAQDGTLSASDLYLHPESTVPLLPLVGLQVQGISPLVTSPRGLIQRTILARYLKELLTISTNQLANV